MQVVEHIRSVVRVINAMRFIIIDGPDEEKAKVFLIKVDLPYLL